VTTQQVMVNAASVGNGLTRQYLVCAHDSLCVGETRKGRRMAQQAILTSVNASDTALEAAAALVLSHAYVLESRMRLAHSMSARAYKLFLRHSNATGQAEALALHSYSASVLGLNSEALQAACDGLSLRMDAPAPLAHARGLNYLGLASFWTRDFGTARGALEASIWFAGEANDAAAGFQPLMNMCFAEVLRIVLCEQEHRDGADLSELERLVARARAMEQSGQCAAFHKATLDIGFLLLDFSSCFVASRRGRTGEADASYLACLERAARFPRTSWVQAMVWWARVERAVAYGDVETSIASLDAMRELAKAGEHAQLQALAGTLEATLRPPLNQWDSIQ
jgi:hypothetical protein